MKYRIIADFILILHFAIVLFIAGGLAGIWIGFALQWHWVRRWWFRVLHLAAMVFITIQSLADMLCPLTVWEQALRVRAGQQGYEESFLQHWVHHMLYYDLPGWIFTIVYCAVLGLIIAAWIVVRPERKNKDL
jgi:hypothetical protein